MFHTFSKEELNSGDGMVTTIWGPPTWVALHTMSFNYGVNPSPEQREAYRSFFTNIADMLPCRHCRDNYKRNLQSWPLNDAALQNRHNFSRWLWVMHEMINRSLNKPKGPSFEEVQQLYENFRARCKVPDPKAAVEAGCTEPLVGEPAKCVLRVMPREVESKSLQVEDSCRLRKMAV